MFEVWCRRSLILEYWKKKALLYTGILSEFMKKKVKVYFASQILVPVIVDQIQFLEILLPVRPVCYKWW